MENKSSRHHYIPQFYAKGFTDKDGLFYVYDKQKDEIIKTKRSPKSVFYGVDKYTIKTDNGESSILEDKFYSDLDNQCAKAISSFRDLPNTDDIYTDENIAFAKFFAINLIWRIPANDLVFDDFYNRTEIRLNNEQGNEFFDNELMNKIKNDESYKKMTRFITPINIIMDVLKEHGKGQTCIAIIDVAAPFFLLSDNPVVFKRTPTNTIELVKSEFLMPMSYRRIYSTEAVSNLDFPFDRAVAFNILQMLHAKHYVCGPDLDVLKSMVNLYKLATLDLNILIKNKRRLFKYQLGEIVE